MSIRSRAHGPCVAYIGTPSPKPQECASLKDSTVNRQIVAICMHASFHHFLSLIVL